MLPLYHYLGALLYISHSVRRLCLKNKYHLLAPLEENLKVIKGDIMLECP